MENKGIVLVTGGTGFVAMRIISQLLETGYQVRTTVRDLKDTGKITAALNANHIELRGLSFEVAELTEDANWAKAMQGCSYVLSVASPVFFHKPKNEAEATRPAVEGILRVLKFAQQAGVKRVVMTSNFGAVGFTQTDKKRETTESDWTNVNAKGLSVYEKSKTLAEMASWDFIKNKGGNLEFATINPVAILGPALSSHFSGSFHLLENLLNGTLKAAPNIPLNVVDVRDVAELHILAMESPKANGQRFIASADGQISIPEIAELLRKEKPHLTQKVTKRRVPTWVLSIAALFNAQAKEALLLATINRNVSNRKAKQLLRWKPVSTQEETILVSVESMLMFDALPKNS